MATQHLGLTENEGPGWIYGGQEITFLHRIVEKQGLGVLKLFSPGITTQYATPFAVSAGVGLQVLVAPGAALLQAADGAVYAVERGAQLALTVPAFSVRYILCALEDSVSNDSRTSKLPLLLVSESDVAPGAIALARITTGAIAVSEIVDLRPQAKLRLSPVPLAPVIVTLATSSTLAPSTNVLEVAASGATTQTLPATLANSWGFVTVKNLGAGTITFAAAAGTTLESGITTLAGVGALSFYLSGTVWRLR